VCLHLSSLPGDYGIGTIGDSALSFIDTLAQTGLSVWQFLPTGPTAYGDSPYQPLSALAGNELLIGLGPLLRLGLLTQDETASLKGMPPDQVDYGVLIPRKMALLAQAARRFTQLAPADLKTAYEDFLHRHGQSWLNDYALYRILKSRHGERPWPEWDSAFMHRDPRALQQAKDNAQQTLEQIRIIQFLFAWQWETLRRHAAEKAICLFADMPIYIALDSADAWAHPEILRIDHHGTPTHVAGVPPDYFSDDGQLWGNPLYNWDYHAANGFQWWISRFRHAAGMADMVRVDHFRGFESYWSVPFGSETARVGEWKPGPGDALFDAMNDAIGQAPIVAENLGVITKKVEALRKRHGIPGMKVLQLELGDEKFRLDRIEENCVCYTGTHDNDTTCGWFHGGGNDTRTPKEFLDTCQNALRLTRGKPETIHRDLIRSAFASPARLAIAPMQDYLGLGSEARLNTPGTTTGNWRWRLTAGQLDSRICESIRSLVEESSRQRYM
jgi:4-alpha-glucanotransferase